MRVKYIYKKNKKNEICVDYSTTDENWKQYTRTQITLSINVFFFIIYPLFLPNLQFALSSGSAMSIPLILWFHDTLTHNVTSIMNRLDFKMLSVTWYNAYVGHPLQWKWYTLEHINYTYTCWGQRSFKCSVTLSSAKSKLEETVTAYFG